MELIDNQLINQPLTGIFQQVEDEF
jgi:hypothetical protein